MRVGLALTTHAYITRARGRRRKLNFTPRAYIMRL